MKIDPEDGPDVDDFVVVEDGLYPVRIAEVRESRREGGDTSWMLRLELTEGPLTGRTIVTDWLNFGEKGMHRVRRVLSALGFDLSKPLELEPAELEGRVACVELATRESMTAGRMQRRSRVTYDGWSPEGALGHGGPEHGDPGIGGGGAAGAAADSMPF